MTEPDDIDAPETKGDRHFVTALARGLDVIACFRRGETFLGNNDIAERCKLPRSTVSRLTYTLTKLGYLHYKEDIGKYRLGTALMAIGSTALGGLDVRRVARESLTDLANFSNASVGLGVRERLTMRYVESMRGPAAISLNIDVGYRHSIARSSMGRAYIAVCSERERRQIFEELQDYDPETWPRKREGIERALQEYQELGCCCSFGDWLKEVSAIAVGFRPGGGLPPMAINCGGPTILVPREFLLSEVRPRLIEVARNLEGVMGA
ncbi:DNA-binding IclR family transcriptional regulator [Pseudochelatococcus lubricantis]|uniref:DNA-binding IclR family transcriptional regulator n=1 Tax=Pseudochelatococcus lubricantis TaxID=1538102 RepID=A0ABX0UYC0_9HYPH|nr:IclR family transcriptional regulator [Pseudochelatococcus lubricantis]NIJ57947.1 DNA-binding IclR family transcriptional regulator [Pseudochelatococcus lubricantis]